MKKIVPILLSFLVLCSLFSVPSLAAGPGRPIIEGEMPDCYVELGGSGVTLFTNASSPDGGTLEYQWYSASAPEMSLIYAIDGATGTSFQVPEIAGVRWYCYAVWNITSLGESAPVYSRLIRVEFYQPTEPHIEILQTPDKVEYTSGESLDLTGLKVRVYTADGYFDSVNGEGLDITKNALVTVGEQKIKVSYGELFDFFIVTVHAAHTHQYGSWKVTKEATCTAAGTKVRECSCGKTEQAAVPASGHKWDDGKITKQPGASSDGEKTYTCTVCGATKVEAMSHTHQYGSWKVTKEPTCTGTGTRVRECSCGKTEQAAVPAAGHQWDAGKVTKQPSEKAGGEKTYTCTVCGTTKVEKIKAGTPVEEPAGDNDPSEKDGSLSLSFGKNTDQKSTASFPWWGIVLLVIAAVLLIGGGTVGIILLIKKKKS